MISYLYTVVTDTAVRAAWRPVEATRRTPFHAHLDALDLHRLVEWGSEVILFVLIFLS